MKRTRGARGRGARAYTYASPPDENARRITKRFTRRFATEKRGKGQRFHLGRYAEEFSRLPLDTFHGGDFSTKGAP